MFHLTYPATAMYQQVLGDTAFYRLLLRFDEKLAAAERRRMQLIGVRQIQDVVHEQQVMRTRG